MVTGRRLVVLVATLLGMALTARLGVWQLDRADQKRAIQTALASRGELAPLDNAALPTDASAVDAQVYRPVALRGEWVASASVFLENRQMDGQPGFFLVTPFRLQGATDAVLVQRGWVPRDLMDRQKVPLVPNPSGTVDLVGVLVPPPSKLYDFAGGATGPIRQNLDLSDFARETGLALRPFSVQQADAPSTAPSPSASPDGLQRRWPRPVVDIQKHQGYAFQWFALCALMAGLYVWFQLLRPRVRRPA